MLFGYGFRAPPKSLLVTFYFSALGIPFKFQRPIDWRLAIAEKGQKILQDNLVFKHYSEHFYQMFAIFFTLFYSFLNLLETDIVLQSILIPPVDIRSRFPMVF